MVRIVACIVALVAVAAPAFGFAGEVVDRIAAVVNKDIILVSEVEELMDLVGPTELRGLSGTELEQAEAQLRIDLVDGLIANKLIEQAMDRADVVVNDRDVEAAIADVARQNGLSVEQLMTELQRQGMDPDEYRVEMRKQLRMYQWQNLEIRSRVSISDEDIRAAWIQASAGQRSATARRLLRIMLAYPAGADDAAKAAIREEGIALLEQLQEGKDFGEVARARSDDVSTKDKGGDAGLFEEKDLSGPFSEALDGAQVGDVVSVEVATGVFLLKVAEEVDVAEAAFEQARDQIARVLYDEAISREIDLWTEEERRRAHIEIFE